jgi:hypothetical protein
MTPTTSADAPPRNEMELDELKALALAVDGDISLHALYSACQPETILALIERIERLEDVQGQAIGYVTAASIAAVSGMPAGFLTYKVMMVRNAPHKACVLPIYTSAAAPTPPAAARDLTDADIERIGAIFGNTRHFDAAGFAREIVKHLTGDAGAGGGE